jgi:transcriptional regulator with GAF, ATPase, and Fis domain
MFSDGGEAVFVEIGRLIARGSFGSVHEAFDPSGARLAVKVVDSSDRVKLGLLRAQYRLLAAADHPRVVRVHELFERPGGEAFLTMEYVDGCPLTRHVSEKGTRGLPVLAACVLDALRHIHSLGGVHGDLKPDNILVCPAGGGYDIKLVDVGFDPEAGERLPTVEGSIPYVAPEIIRSSPADGRTDLYSLGVTLYETLTGDSPFSGSSQEETMARHLEYTPPPPSACGDGIDPAWDGFVMKLLNKEPGLRFRDALEAGINLSRAFGDSSLLTGSLTPPGSLVHLWGQYAGQVIDVMSRMPGRAVVVGGSSGSGVASILRETAGRLKSEGTRAVLITMDGGNPVSAQVIRALAGPGSELRYLAGEDAGDVSDSHVISLGPILEAYDVDLGPDRRIALILDGGDIDRAGLRAMSDLAARYGELVSVIVGVEWDGASGEARPGRGAAEWLEIAPLTRTGLEEELKAHFGVSSLPAGLADSLYGNTRGSASLLEQTLAELWKEGDLGYRLSDDVLGIEWRRKSALPGSLRQIIEDKIGALDRGGLEVAAMINLAGGTLEREIILAAGGGERRASALSGLIEAGLVEVAGERDLVRFRFSQTVDLIERRLEPGWVSRTALELGDAVESAAAGAGDRYRAGLLFLAAGAADRALPHFTAAGEYFAKFSLSDAMMAYTRALDCDPPDDKRAEIEILVGDMKVADKDLDGARVFFERASGTRPDAGRKLGWVMALEGGYGAAENLLVEYADRAREAGGLVEMGRVYLDLGFVYAMQSKIEDAMRVLGEALALFEARGMNQEAGLAAYRAGIANYRSGNYSAMKNILEKAVAHFERAGSRRHIAISLSVLGLALRKELDFRQAEESLRKSLRIWDELRILHEKAAASRNYALVLLDTGDLRRARGLVDEALEVETLIGNDWGITMSKLVMCEIDLEAGNWRRAESLAAEVLAGTREEDSFQKALVKRYLGMARSLAGDMKQAIALIEESHSLAGAAGDEEGEGQALLEKARTLIRFGKAESAAEPARRALVSFGASSSLLLAERAEAVLGEALCASGRADEGARRLVDARRNLEVVGGSQHMGRVLSALARLAFASRDHSTFMRHFSDAVDLFRKTEARYDYAATLHLGGMEALERGSFMRARHLLVEAGRVYDNLGIQDLREKVVKSMEAIPGGEIEIKAVNALSRISESLLSSSELDDVLNRATDLAMDYLGADRGVLMLAEDGNGELSTVVERKMDEESLMEVLDISKSIVESVRSTGKPVIATDLRDDPRFKESRSVRVHNIMSVMCLPLVRGDRLLGVIYLDARGIPSQFTDLEKAFVDAFANQVSLALDNARKVGRLHDSCEDLKARAGEKYSFRNIVGPGRKMQEVFRQVEKAARSDTTVLITGENGTGKDLVAGLLHELSPRKAKPFVFVDCPAFAKNLLESEIFGIEKSVATGVAPRIGVFERAHGGTIYLNEIGDVPLTTQVKILRFLQEMAFERVGGNRVIKVDVRVVSATNQDVSGLIKGGLFRKDLYYRLNGIRIHLAPLRERMEDLPYLVNHFLAEYSKRNSRNVETISEDALAILMQHTWPGNVRELEKCIEHGVVFSEGTEITADDLPDEVMNAARSGGTGTLAGGPLPDRVRQFERTNIVAALEAHNWVKSRAARELGIHEATLRKKMKVLDIKKPRD